MFWWPCLLHLLIQLHAILYTAMLIYLVFVIVAFYLFTRAYR